MTSKCTVSGQAGAHAAALAFIVAGLLSSFQGPRTAENPATPATDACAGLRAFHAPAVEITAAADRPAETLTTTFPGRPPVDIALPRHCLVTGIIEKRVGVAGRAYGIQFELRMPSDWNGRFLFQGGGGLNGVVAPAIGLVKGPAALTRGFAVVSQDAGHEGSDASFGEDQQARLDMEYRSYDRVTTIAKQVIAAFYGKPADHSYFMGCSEGGREALLASQRLPLEYDGVVAGDPGFLLGVSFGANTDRMTIAQISPKAPDGQPDYSKAFSDTDLHLVEARIEAECDDKDGLKDGLIDNPMACHPKLESLACKTARKQEQCLSKAQVQALHAIFDGGRPTGGDGLLSSGYFYDTAVDLPAWRGKLAGFGGLRVTGVGSFQGFFLTPYDPGFNESVVDFAAIGPRLREVGALNRADGVMYSSFKAHAGKILIYTGLADPAFSAKELIAYYQRLAAANGGLPATTNFARLFLVPGMTHCGGGRSLDDFDPLQSVVDWVESNKPPERMVATGRAFPGRSRPLCPYPLQSRYTGSGSIEDAANFTCSAAQ